ncbi:MAG: hypothetical protein A2231_11425 [Candidatus Firestonebacteria bacterium RIFOXYA2_FULL_40_8]|nr:MAG: hypothetical protein A2231_11425 [Candidatus Firestonebacteria bacterium RIFOXYA2_FULL_40_8]
MPEKTIIRNDRYNLVEREGCLYIIPQKPKGYALYNMFKATFIGALLVCLLLFPPAGIFSLLILLLHNSIKKGLT